MTTNTIVIDLETNIKNRGDSAVGNFEASPYHPGNGIVAYGWKYNDQETSTSYKQVPTWELLQSGLLIAHNVQFELSYLLKFHKEELEQFLKKGGKIWCTATVEYLLTNLQHKFPSLDDTCIKYGGVLKDDRIKEYWKAGIDTEQIPENELIPYLVGDVNNTYLVYQGQLKLAEEFGMLALIDCHMESILALAYMSYNGMKFDTSLAIKTANTISEELQQVNREITEYMKQFFVPEFEVNPNSNQQQSLVLFGGSYEYRNRGPVLNKDGEIEYTYTTTKVPKVDDQGNPVFYKSGLKKGEQVFTTEKTIDKPKEKWYTYIKRTEGLGIKPDSTWGLKKEGMYSVSENIIKAILNQKLPESTKQYLNNLLRTATLDKDLNTYYIGYTNLTWPHSKLIHPNFNCSATNTGRLSSSSPKHLGL